VTVIFEPHPGPQTKFMRFDGRYALYGGAANSGKSQCLMFDPMRQIEVETKRVNAGEIPQSTGRAIYFRRTMPELREMIDRSKRYFHLWGAQWIEQAKTWTFPCGYKYMFGQMEETSDWIKYYGFEFSEIIFDELTTFTEEQFDQMDTRLRSSDPVLKNMLYMRAGTNPVGIGLEWVRKRFVEPAPPGTPVVRRVKTPVVENGILHYEYVEHKQIFIPAKVSDNPSVDQAQYAATLVTKSNAVKRQLLDGDWYVVSGAFLADLWDPNVHVCDPFPIPKSWYKFRSCDYGYANPASVSWWAVDPDNNFVCFRNLTVKKHNAEMLAGRIKEIEMELGLWDIARGCSRLTGPLDYEAMANRGHIGPSIAETMWNVGVHWFSCTKDRRGAADQIRWRLARRTGHPTIKDKETGKPALIIPGIRWFKTCKDPIRTLPVLPSDENDPEVPDTKADDHNYDDTSYACMSRPLIPDREKSDDGFDQDDLSAARQKVARGGSRGKRTGYLW